MKQVFSFLFCISFCCIGCSKDDVNPDFEVPELTSLNSISFTVNTANERNLFIYAGGEYVAIDWGDGTENKYQIPHNEQCMHRYRASGTYNVKIWSEHLTFLNLSSLMQDITNLEVDNCPVLESLMLDGFSDIEHFKLEGCPRLTHLNLGNWENLTSLNISKCTALKQFYCYTHPKLTSLDLSAHKKLENLTLAFVGLEELDLTHNTELIDLSIQAVKITTLDVEKNKRLAYIYCYQTDLEELKIAENHLSVLMVANNKLKTLDLSLYPDLYELRCDGNELTSIDLTPCPYIHAFSGMHNQLTELKIPEKSRLEQVYISSNAFGAEALNAIFTALPNAQVKYPNSRALPPPRYSSIQYNFNPGAEGCKKEIITKKGWRITVEKQ
ncbi:leucine-rich repeat domain-containing protein [Bacteroides sp. 519]|uniref:leucine-rich repeat domain-containing protein n=1 Tax=Bacteroides sp. 519 TaxID=2302937 RepID=UPI0013D386EF|nr:leucine-rich repeat domain-containing protein [Bacteroides sp. 519]NDV57203.1 leucine-rich repeat domain-containing protein [Bacteroides sp. 519]